MVLEKYIVRAYSKNSQVDGFIGEDNHLYYDIRQAQLFNRVRAITKARENEAYWDNVRVEKVKIEINL